jgi:hypothetical protein
MEKPGKQMVHRTHDPVDTFNAYAGSVSSILGLEAVVLPFVCALDFCVSFAESHGNFPDASS